MDIFWILAALCAAALLAVLITAYICYRTAFYEPDRKPQSDDTFDIPKGRIYEPFRESIINWTRETRAMPREDMYITSFDGLKLHGRYYEYAPGAPIELMMHGYRGAADRDLSGGVQRCFKLGRSALIVDQRCSGESGGNVITFGINEHRDCLSWVEHMISRFGPDVKIILTGISMGASTVLTAAGKPLPKNVIGVLADCGYDSAKNIIQKVIADMGLPPRLAYPFVKLGARLFGHFDLEENSPIEAVKKSRIPLVVIHGATDDFVPTKMGERIYDACQSKKKLYIVPNAAHGLAYPANPDEYVHVLHQAELEWNL